MSTNSITASGLTIKSLSDVINAIQNGESGYPGLYQIYGPTINLNPNSPDANMVNIFALAVEDTLELLQQIYTSMDPDQAVGVTLDSRCAINGVIRQAGTYTQQPVLVTNTSSVTLPGLDLYPTTAFTVSDGTNQYQLLTTTTLSTASSTSLIFQAVNMGPVQSSLNSITSIVTVTLGVTSVNNPNPYTSLGVAQETDSALRIRRSYSVAQPSKGYLAGLYGALIDIDGINYASVYENITATTDVNGVPGHSIWCIVSGTNNSTVQTEVANAIYVKRNAGCGMKGSISISVPQLDGTNFSVLFDYATTQPLYFKCTAEAITGSISTSNIAQSVFNYFANSYSINQIADTTSIVSYIKSQYPNVVISGEAVSKDGTTWSTTVSPTAVNYQFIIPANTSTYINITS